MKKINTTKSRAWSHGTTCFFAALAGCSLLGGCTSDAESTPIDSAGGESAGGQSGKDEDASGGDSGEADPDKSALVIGEVTFDDLPAYTASKVACQAEVSGPSASEKWSWTNDTQKKALKGTGSSIKLTYDSAKPGDTITCTLEVTDDSGKVHKGEASAKIKNRAPTILKVNAPSSLFNTDTLDPCEVEASDPDGGKLTVKTFWESSANPGTPLPQELTPNLLQPGDSLVCQITVTDEQGAKDTATSSVSVGNREPTLTLTTISPAIPYDDEVVSCSASGSDPDGTALSYSYEWTNESTSVSLGTEATLDFALAAVEAGEVIRCSASASDGTASTAGFAETSAVTNQPPTFEVSSTALNLVEDAGAVEMSDFIIASDPGALGEAGQLVHFEVVVDSADENFEMPYFYGRVPAGDALFAEGGAPTVSDDGTLKFTLADDAWGMSGFTITAVDERGARSAGQHIELAVEGLADAAVQVTSALEYTTYIDETLCVEIALNGNGYLSQERPAATVASLPSEGTISQRDCSKPNCVGTPSMVGDAIRVPSYLCYTAPENGGSTPQDRIDVSFEMTFRTDYNILSASVPSSPELTFPEGHFNAPESTTATVEVHIIPRYLP